MYVSGLDWLDLEAKKKYKIPFAKLTAEQADAILKPWLQTWMNDHPPSEVHADFVNIAHNDIRTATINSKAWSDTTSAGAQERTPVALYWSPIEPDVYDGIGSRNVPLHVIAAPKSTHQMPAYPR
jgi:hypothetical protein